jgi:hypothetical protein
MKKVKRDGWQERLAGPAAAWRWLLRGVDLRVAAADATRFVCWFAA